MPGRQPTLTKHSASGDQYHLHWSLRAETKAPLRRTLIQPLGPVGPDLPKSLCMLQVPYAVVQAPVFPWDWWMLQGWELWLIYLCTPQQHPTWGRPHSRAELGHQSGVPHSTQGKPRLDSHCDWVSQSCWYLSLYDNKHFPTSSLFLLLPSIFSKSF